MKLTEKEKEVLKKIVTRNYVKGFILISLFSLGLMIAGFNKIYWMYLALILGYWALFCGVLGITTYFYQKSHPKLSRIVIQPQVQSWFAAYLMVFGGAFIIMTIYKLFFRITEQEKRIIFILGGFGIFVFLWGYLEYTKHKKINNYF